MYKIMIVDDEDIARIGLQTLLDWEEYGFEITYKATNGIEAIEIARNENPDLIISDVVMPIMDGIEMVKQLKKYDYKGEIIIISNHNNLQAVKQLIRLGVEDYLLKISYKKEDFVNILNNVKNKLDKKNSLNLTKNSDIKHTIKEIYFSNEKGNKTIQKRSLFYIKLLNNTPQKSKSTVEKIKIIISQNFKNSKDTECFMISSNEVIALVKASDDTTIFSNTEARIKKMLELYTMLQSVVLSVHNICDMDTLRMCVEKCKKLSENVFYGEVCGNVEKYKNEDISSYINSVQIASHFIKKLENYEINKVESDIRNILTNLKNSLINKFELLNFTETSMVVIQAQVNQIYNVETNSELIKNIKVCNNINELFSLVDIIFEDIYKKIQQSQNVSLHINESDETINKALQYINEHISQKITLSDIANAVNMHPNYLSSYFNKKVKCSITRYINNIKLEQAKKLLVSKNLKVKDVAEKIGIADVSYFSKLYKEKFGYYPSETENIIMD